MTVKIIEEIHSSHNRRHDNLDQDLCNDCTESFEAWWESKL